MADNEGVASELVAEMIEKHMKILTLVKEYLDHLGIPEPDFRTSVALSCMMGAVICAAVEGDHALAETLKQPTERIMARGFDKLYRSVLPGGLGGEEAGKSGMH